MFLLSLSTAAFFGTQTGALRVQIEHIVWLFSILLAVTWLYASVNTNKHNSYGAYGRQSGFNSFTEKVKLLLDK